jgi:hypothetical protein
VSAAEGGGLVADLDPDWNVGPGILNGGYLVAVVARAALAGSPHAHPAAVAVSFLQATPPGPATLAVTRGPAGATLAHASVVLAGAAGPSVVAQVASATLTAADPEYSTAPPPSATPVEQCLAPVDVGALPRVGLSRQVETRLDPATSGWATGRPSEEPLIRAWVRFADGRDPDPVSLVFFSDVLPPTCWAIGRFGWAPTVQLQVLVRAVPAPGWCLVEARADEVAGGWFDSDCRIWDSTGRLVAQSRQLARTPR